MTWETLLPIPAPRLCQIAYTWQNLMERLAVLTPPGPLNMGKYYLGKHQKIASSF